MNFEIDKEVFDLVPTLQVGVLVLSNVDNRKSITGFFNGEYEKMESQVKVKFGDLELAEYPLVKKWREYIEALVKKRRVLQLKHLFDVFPVARGFIA